jgi:signal transduction histidine kinase
MSSTFGRVLLFRHLAICVSALLAYILRREIEVGYAVLAVVTGSAIVNFGLYLMRWSPRTEPLAVRASPVVGVGAWTALIAVTNGVGSPFVAGLTLEVMLAGMLFGSTSVLFITGSAAAALTGQQVALGLVTHELALSLQIAFLTATGGAVWAFRRRSEAREREFALEQRRLDRELGRLELELEDERLLGRVGENVGRLAHGLKNSVHGLRGFVALLEPSVGEKGRPALEGLRGAIEDLESLARLTLEENRAIARERDRAQSGPDAVIGRAVAEVRTTHPEVVWNVRLPSPLPAVGIGDEELEEVILILLRNAIEAMPGGGHAAVRATADRDGVRIAVEDAGKGIGPGDLEKIFRAGYTTKARGSGYGLFLARRIVGDHGGALAARSAPGGGAIFEIRVPTVAPVPSSERPHPDDDREGASESNQGVRS